MRHYKHLCIGLVILSLSLFAASAEGAVTDTSATEKIQLLNKTVRFVLEQYNEQQVSNSNRAVQTDIGRIDSSRFTLGKSVLEEMGGPVTGYDNFMSAIRPLLDKGDPAAFRQALITNAVKSISRPRIDEKALTARLQPVSNGTVGTGGNPSMGIGTRNEKTDQAVDSVRKELATVQQRLAGQPKEMLTFEQLVWGTGGILVVILLLIIVLVVGLILQKKSIREWRERVEIQDEELKSLRIKQTDLNKKIEQNNPDVSLSGVNSRLKGAEERLTRLDEMVRHLTQRFASGYPGNESWTGREMREAESGKENAGSSVPGYTPVYCSLPNGDILYETAEEKARFIVTGNEVDIRTAYSQSLLNSFESISGVVTIVAGDKNRGETISTVQKGKVTRLDNGSWRVIEKIQIQIS